METNFKDKVKAMLASQMRINAEKQAQIKPHTPQKKATKEEKFNYISSVSLKTLPVYKLKKQSQQTIVSEIPSLNPTKQSFKKTLQRNKYEAAKLAHINALRKKVLAQEALKTSQDHVTNTQKAFKNATNKHEAIIRHLKETTDVESKANLAMAAALETIATEKHNKLQLQKEQKPRAFEANETLQNNQQNKFSLPPGSKSRTSLTSTTSPIRVSSGSAEVKTVSVSQEQMLNKSQEEFKVLEVHNDIQKEKKVGKSPLEHCEEVFSRFKDSAIEEKPESYHKAVLMEAADKLKKANLDSITISNEGNYSGGFKNGKKHGFGYKSVYERYYAGNSSCCDWSKTWQVHIDGEYVWSHQFASGGW